MSIVRNVALFGRPIAGPVIASISSIVVLPRLEHFQRAHHAEKADAVGDEVRRVACLDDPLAKPFVGKASQEFDDGGVGVGGGNDLEEVQVARRVEEMRACEMRSKPWDRPSASALIGMPEVFEVTIAPFARTWSMRSKS